MNTNTMDRVAAIAVVLSCLVVAAGVVWRLAHPLPDYDLRQTVAMERIAAALERGTE